MVDLCTQRRFEIAEAGRRALREWEPRNGAAAPRRLGGALACEWLEPGELVS
jgi:hypothetical protein